MRVVFYVDAREADDACLLYLVGMGVYVKIRSKNMRDDVLNVAIMGLTSSGQTNVFPKRFVQHPQGSKDDLSS